VLTPSQFILAPRQESLWDEMGIAIRTKDDIQLDLRFQSDIALSDIFFAHRAGLNIWQRAHHVALLHPRVVPGDWDR
jgi:hypothetical protein